VFTHATLPSKALSVENNSDNALTMLTVLKSHAGEDDAGGDAFSGDTRSGAGVDNAGGGASSGDAVLSSGDRRSSGEASGGVAM